VTFKDLTTSHATSIINQIASHEGLKIPDEFKEGMFLQAQGSIRALLNNIQAFAEDGFDPNQATDDEAALEVKTLFKLITKGDWTKLSKELSRSNVRKEPESLRMGLENYMRVVLLGTPNIGEAAKLGNAMIRLRGSLYDEKSSNAMYNAFIVKCLRACCVFI
jgi:DNA polymerase III delta prime subunit